MIDPVNAREIVLAALLSGGILLFGTLYAAFYALSKRLGRPRLGHLAVACGVALACASTGLSIVLNLTGIWTLVVVALLAGYLLAPIGVWRLAAAVDPVATRGSRGGSDFRETAGDIHGSGS
jgi:hypothetical protein